MTPATIELRIGRIDPTILAVLAQVVRVATPAISVAPPSTVTTVPNAIASRHIVTFLTTPVAFSLDGVRDLFIN